MWDPPLCTKPYMINSLRWGYIYSNYKNKNKQKKRYTFGSLPRDPPDLTSLSSLSMDGEGTLDLGLPGMEHSEPASNESSWLSISSSRTHLWQMLCWQGRISGWVKSSLHIGQISSLSMFLIGTCRWEAWLLAIIFRGFFFAWVTTVAAVILEHSRTGDEEKLIRLGKKKACQLQCLEARMQLSLIPGTITYY